MKMKIKSRVQLTTCMNSYPPRIPVEEVWPRVKMEFKKAMLNSSPGEGSRGAYKDNSFRPSAILHFYSNFARRWLSPVIDAPTLISCDLADCEV
jgi:hypothetical protein